MFSTLSNFFTRRKKEKLRQRNNKKSRVVLLDATPAKRFDENGDELSMPSITPVPYWYEQNRSFENMVFQYPKDMTPPSIRTEMREALKNFVKEIAPEPDGSMVLYSKLNDPNASIKEITSLVSSDPILAARILKLVNSAAFGLPHEVSAIGRAVTLLGFANVKAAVLQHSLQKGISSIDGEYAAIVREHSIMSSAIALHIADTMPKTEPFAISSIALLHDIGKVMYPTMKAEGKNLQLTQEVPEQVIEALIASVFGELWGLPEYIYKTLEYIHHPYFYPLESVPEAYRESSTIIAMANLLASAMGFRDGEDAYEIGLDYLKQVRMIDEPASWIDEKMATKIESTRGALQ